MELTRKQIHLLNKVIYWVGHRGYMLGVNGFDFDKMYLPNTTERVRDDIIKVFEGKDNLLSLSG